jgi:hypothetical protein
MKDIISDEDDMCMISRIIRQYQQQQVHPYYHQKISIILTAMKLIKAKNTNYFDPQQTTTLESQKVWLDYISTVNFLFGDKQLKRDLKSI